MVLRRSVSQSAAPGDGSHGFVEVTTEENPLDRCSAAEVLAFLGVPLASDPDRHHCLAKLQGDKPLALTDRMSRHVQTLFHAALRQQLQGPPCAGLAQHALSRNRDRYSA